MTQENKELLLQDLCARLPYKVMIQSVGENKCLGLMDLVDIDLLPKPYLRPMSSMTEEESKEFAMLQTDFYIDGWLYPIAAVNMVNWLIVHHFDYHNLIEKGLAIEVTESNNPYKTLKT